MCSMIAASTDDSVSGAAGVAAVGLADGTVTVLQARMSPRTDNEPLAWGVSPVTDQYCLSYPCIGIGCVMLDASAVNHDGTVPYVVCCLRGTATYMIPASSPLCNDNHHAKPVIALSVPHDSDDDSPLRYLQGFTAVNVGGTAGQHGVQLLVYVWPGGIVDVYSCTLLRDTAAPKGPQFLQELVGNGSADLLRDLLVSLDASELDNVASDWIAARAEVQEFGGKVPIGFNELCSDRFAAFRLALTHMHTVG